MQSMYNRFSLCQENEYMKPRIIEFSHPGSQLKISKRSQKNEICFRFDENSTSEGVRFWNKMKFDHYRKFLESDGLVLKNNNGEIKNELRKEKLFFWGEWEADSYFKLLPNKNKLLPNSIHFPFFNSEEKLRGKHNTDPYVFGDCFYYTNCKQTRNKMNQLEEYSLIIFGTEYHSREVSGFAVDTVFIVKKSLPFEDQENFSEIFRTVNLEVVKQQKQQIENLRIYESLTYKDNKEFFSYVPCKIKTEITQTGFKRPMLNFKKFRLQNPGAGTVLKEIDEPSIINYWQEITAEILFQGFDLAVKVDEPPLINSYN